MERNLNFNFGLTVLLVTTLLAFHINASGQDLTVKFYNKTGFDLDGLTIGTTLIGSVANDSSSNFIEFSEFMLDSGYPYEKVKGSIKNTIMTSYDWSWCGSERFPVYEGTLEYDVVLKEYEGDNYLYLKRHQ